MGGMNVAMTIISLVLIEKAGRKTLMLIGLGIMLICTTCLLICLVVSVWILNWSYSLNSHIEKIYELKLVKSIFWKCLNLYIFQSPVASYLSIVFVIMFVVGFATGPGSIPWFFVNELFQQSARPMAASMAVVTNWTANFLVGLCFLPMQVSKA